jgi:hypothetical protein
VGRLGFHAKFQQTAIKEVPLGGKPGRGRWIIIEK